MNGDHTVFICSENINSVNATCRILQQAWKVKVTRRHEAETRNLTYTDQHNRRYQMALS